MRDAAARRSGGQRVAPGRDRRLDSAGLVPPPGGGRAREKRRRLVRLYFTSVGRNSKLLLNVPPTRDGVLHDVDVESAGDHARAAPSTMFAIDLAAGAAVFWQPVGERRATVELDLRGPRTIAIAALSEDITQGQIVSRYMLEGERDGAWLPLSEGTTIGYRKLDRFDPVAVRRVRLTISRRGRHAATRSDRRVRAGVAFALEMTHPCPVRGTLRGCGCHGKFLARSAPTS